MAETPGSGKAESKREPTERTVAAGSRPPSTVGAAKKEHVQKILDGFQQEIEPVAGDAGYLFGMLLVAVVLFMLVAVYLAIVASMGFLVGMSLLRMIQSLHLGLLSPGFFLVLLPIWLLGLLFLLFLIKPLFAPSVEDRSSIRLRPENEPQLFEFLGLVCQAVHAPPPSEVVVNCDVNASAGFSGLSGPFTGRTQLVLGLPLVAGLNSQQLAGVVAHEFGHLSQRVAMRFSLFIRLMNHWLLRVAHERDVWDYWLARAIAELPQAVAWPLFMVSLGVGGVRTLLMGFFMLGHFVSLYLMREMEFNADQYEARLVGARAFAGTTWRLHLLGQATRGASFDTIQAWREKRLADNYPALVAANVEQISRRARDEMAEHLRSTETSVWDTHPSPKERVDRVNADDPQGVYQIQLPAPHLFCDFDRLCQRVSVAWYSSLLGSDFKRKSLVPVERLVASSKLRQSNRIAWLRYFQGLLFPLRPLVITNTEVAPIAADQIPLARESVMRLRRAPFKRLTESEQAYDKFHDFDDLKLRALRATALLECNLELDADSFGFSDGSRGTVTSNLRRAIEGQRELSPQLDRFEALQKKRLSTALSLLRTPGVGDRVSGFADKRKVTRQVIAVGEAMLSAMPALIELRNDMDGFMSLVLQRIDLREHPAMRRQVLAKATSAGDYLHRIEHRLCDQPYPFDHARGKISIAAYLFDGTPGIEEPADVAATADVVIDRTAELYFRLMEELSGIATEVERSLGLPPLPIPWTHPAAEHLEEQFDELELAG